MALAVPIVCADTAAAAAATLAYAYGVHPSTPRLPPPAVMGAPRAAVADALAIAVDLEGTWVLPPLASPLASGSGPSGAATLALGVARDGRRFSALAIGGRGPLLAVAAGGAAALWDGGTVLEGEVLQHADRRGGWAFLVHDVLLARGRLVPPAPYAAVRAAAAELLAPDGGRLRLLPHVATMPPPRIALRPASRLSDTAAAASRAPGPFLLIADERGGPCIMPRARRDALVWLPSPPPPLPPPPPSAPASAPMHLTCGAGAAAAAAAVAVAAAAPPPSPPPATPTLLTAADGERVLAALPWLALCA